MILKEWEASGNYFSYQNNKIFYRKRGKGELLVVFHGFPTSSWDWHKMSQELEESFEVLYFDMLGYGFSDKPKIFNYSIHQQADYALALIEHLGIKDFHILAHDKGDTVANEILARQLEGKVNLYIRSCCLLNGGLFPGIHKPRLVQKALMTPLGKYIARLYSFKMFQSTFRKIFGPQTQASNTELEQLWWLMNHKEGMQVFHLLIHYMRDRVENENRWLVALQETKVPLRLINGAFDPISGKHMARHFEQVIPNPDVILLQNIGHYPQLEAPKDVFQAFIDFHQKLVSNSRFS